MGSKKDTPKETDKQAELLAYLDSIGSDESGELDSFTRRVGAGTVKLLGPDKKPIEVAVRPISQGSELCVGSAIPRPPAPMVEDGDGVMQPDYADETYLARLAIRDALWLAAIAALAIDIALDDGRSYRKPGTHDGGNNAARTLFVRDAAKHMILNHTGDEIERIVEKLNQINDPAKLIDEAGKSSAPTSATSKKTRESGASRSPVSAPTSSQDPAPTDQDS